MPDIHYQQLLDRWRSLCAELAGKNVELLAVSKYAKDGDVAALIAAGQKDFAESRPQQLRDRATSYPDIRWHMIGPLQKNKAKYIARHAAMWHSVGDVDTAHAVARHVTGRQLPVLLQVNIAGVTHQHGIAPESVSGLAAQLLAIPQLVLTGLMCMVPHSEDAGAFFARLHGLRDALLDGSLGSHPAMPKRLKLCMGMSGDYRVALAEGADMVRIGSGLFDSELVNNHAKG